MEKNWKFVAMSAVNKKIIYQRCYGKLLLAELLEAELLTACSHFGSFNIKKSTV